ncbi:Radical SAM superfamily enzyme YgiQ, UPF0313 family [Syntrophus gentianae]|uniref:Radical SAM superfamily enzyme YgiQ, UPF0313 family n=1 Tax=Syntrophus gentianae TaxID=43775 RepID=A0A1H7XD48_9BACT|nr:radical SAM protein [Syntrophus gentianae]SEM31792.1 Radical SAM superfamily enzyme YgiQ, UPF0313 family [Syntrophus gentianae]
MRNANVLLINPWIYDFAAYDFWSKPLGLLYLAGILRKNSVNVQLIDCLNPLHPGLTEDKGIKKPRRKSSGQGQYPKEILSKPEPLQGIPRNYHRYGIPPRLFRQELHDCAPPDIVLVTSMMTYWYPGVFDAITVVREIFPDVPILLGGNYVTLCPDHARLSGADFILPGEGERHLRFIMEEVLQLEIQYLPDPTNLDSLPYPAFDLLPYKEQVPIMTSRGCPFRCIYCASHLLNSSFRRRSPELVADEIAFWNRQFGISHFSFYDDAFLMNPEEMAIPLMEEIIRRDLSCQFHCPNGLHLRSMDEKISRLMIRSGFRTLRFGFETSNSDQQVRTGGKVTNEHLNKAISCLKQAGYEPADIGLYLLCGLPGQSAQEVEESIRFVLSFGAKPVLAEFSPIPGTGLWDRSVQTSPYDLANEPLYHNNTLLPCRHESFTYEDYRKLKSLIKARGETASAHIRP